MRLRCEKCCWDERVKVCSFHFDRFCGHLLPVDESGRGSGCSSVVKELLLLHILHRRIRAVRPANISTITTFYYCIPQYCTLTKQTSSREPSFATFASQHCIDEHHANAPLGIATSLGKEHTAPYLTYTLPASKQASNLSSRERDKFNINTNKRQPSRGKPSVSSLCENYYFTLRHYIFPTTYRYSHYHYYYAN